MESIKFTGKYAKMPKSLVECKPFQLLEVFKTRFELLSDSFVLYDTTKVGSERYKLPDVGDCIVLLFRCNGPMWDTGEVFTTVRGWNVEKEEYYRGLRGNYFTVEWV